MAAVSGARRAAYEVLLRVFEDDAYADRAFRSAAEGLDERERAFAQRLAYGSVQRVRTLDHAIGTLGRRPVRKLDPPVRAALRLGAYQLGYTDAAPHAAVNESVELVRGARLERAVPFTNAVMRRLAEGIRPLLDSLPDGPLKESYPDWIHETFVRVLGEEGALALMRAMNEPLETAVRLVSGEPPSRAEATDIPGAYRVGRVDETLVAAGRIWPQSRGSQLAGLCVGSRESERVLDVCAAPGGKTGQLRGEVTAVEIDPARARELRENLATMGRGDVIVVEADGTALPPKLAGFDHALVDAPCSGLGVLAQRPDLRWRARRLEASSAEPTTPRRTRRAGGGGGPRHARPNARGAGGDLGAPGASARAPACGGRAGAARGHDRLLRLHPQPGRVRSGRRRERPPRPPARRGVACVPASVATGLPPHAAARPRHDRLLRRATRGRLNLVRSPR